MSKIKAIPFLIAMLLCLSFAYAEVLSLSLSDTGTVIAPGKQILTIDIEKPSLTILKDVSLRIYLNGSAQFADGTKEAFENFSSIEGDFSKDYEIILEPGLTASSFVDIKAEISYYESKKRYWVFGDRIKTEEPTKEEQKVSFTAVYTEVAPLETELSTCKAEKETLKNQLAVMQQEKQKMADTIKGLEDENINLKKYRTRFYILIVVIILIIAGSATYVWYSKFKK